MFKTEEGFVTIPLRDYEYFSSTNSKKIEELTKTLEESESKFNKLLEEKRCIVIHESFTGLTIDCYDTNDIGNIKDVKKVISAYEKQTIELRKLKSMVDVENAILKKQCGNLKEENKMILEENERLSSILIKET